MRQTISVKFHLRAARANKAGQAPIYMRVMLGPKKFDVITKIYIDQKHWSSEYCHMRNTTEDARKINDILDGFKMKAYDYQRELMTESKPITIDNFRLKWYGKSMERPRMLMEIFEQHNKQMTALVGKEFSPLTLERYETSKRHTESFLRWKYKVSDIDIKALKY